MMAGKDKKVDGIRLEDEELEQVNSGLRVQGENEIRPWIEQAEGKSMIIEGGGAELIDDEALEAVSGGLRVQST